MKPKLIFRGPITTASGYGVHSRQLLKALLASDLYDVSVAATNWGQTPFIYDDETYLDLIKKLVLKREQNEKNGVEYDISVQVTIPNEFVKLAKLNVGVTAGIEVDRVSPEWIAKINENVDFVIVPSKHSAETLVNVVYRTQEGKEHRVIKPVAIIPEGIDTNVFNTDHVAADDVLAISKNFFKPDFNFLFVGLGLDKGMGEDRKNISILVKWFCERFKDDPNVGLILKTAIVNNSLLDFETCKRKIEEIKSACGCGELTNIYLLHGRMSEHELAALYKHPKVKAFISLTHGEGYGLPLIEAAACGLPIVATNWSGHLDFLSINGNRRFIPIEYDLTQIPNSVVWKGVMEEGAKWANPKEEDAKLKMKKIILSYDKPKEWAVELSEHIKNNYSIEKVCHLFVDIISDFLNKFYESHPNTNDDFVNNVKKQLNIVNGEKTILYTMPMSAGDVYISSAIISSLKKKYPEHKIFFATDERYAAILKNNPNIHNIINFKQWMCDVQLCEKIFSDVYTPNLAIQMSSSNWIRGGKGRRLAEEIAAQCQVELGDYYIHHEPIDGLPETFIAFHPGSGKGQWEARNYLYWQEVVENLGRLSGIPIVQIGTMEDSLYNGCIDFRGKTTYNQLAYVIGKAACLVGIDSVSMHMAAGIGTKHVAIFGSSYANSTGPTKSKALSVLLETQNRYTCDKACYKYKCLVNNDYPCINEIKPKDIVASVLRFFDQDNLNEYNEYHQKISGYTHILNPDSHGFPFIESITSMLGFCDEVIVVDGGSTDGSLEKISAIGDERIKIYNRGWDWKEPGMDGMQKAYGRAMCTGDFLWQQDADEVVHEEDYEKIKNLVKIFPRDTDLLHLPIIELWGGGDLFRTDRHSWKWRISRNNFRITHGINKDARIIDDKTGKTYAKKGMSDGCEYIDIMTGTYIRHKGFYTRDIEILRQSDQEAYANEMNRIFKELPCVFHYSWANIPRKIRNFRDFWDRCWSNLYNESNKEQRFFIGRDMKDVTDEEIMLESINITARGGEHDQGYPFQLERSNPACIKLWLENIVNEYKIINGAKIDSRHIHHDKTAAASPAEIAQIA